MTRLPSLLVPPSPCLPLSSTSSASLTRPATSISHLQEGKTAEVCELADEMVTVFRDLEVSREPMAAVLLFQEAARRETATAELAAKSPLRSPERVEP